MTAPAMHECQPCRRCAGCACHWVKGLCRRCDHYETALRDAGQEQRRWAAELDSPELEFALTSSTGPKIHLRTCPSIKAAVTAATAILDWITPENAGQGLSPEWPRLLTRKQAIAAGRPPCRTCAPDTPPKPKRVKRVASGLGWPLSDGSCVKYAADIVRSQARIQP